MRASYAIVLLGHGLLGGSEFYGQTLAYLDFAEEALKKAADATDFKQRLLESFPGYGRLKVVDHQMRFLF